MGKSDNVILPIYWDFLEKNLNKNGKNAAFLGQEKENYVSIRTPGHHAFYDLALGNWDINSDWHLEDEYDAIICTRTAYFSRNPQEFIKKCKSHLKKDGIALVDWGLGDHWRFPNYKVGWIKDGEHEWAYAPNNKLHSCFWHSEVENDSESALFWEAVIHKESAYSRFKNLEEVVREEVPSLIHYPVKKMKIKFLWPESPQLYIITLIEK